MFYNKLAHLFVAPKRIEVLVLLGLRPHITGMALKFHKMAIEGPSALQARGNGWTRWSRTAPGSAGGLLDDVYTLLRSQLTSTASSGKLLHFYSAVADKRVI